MIDLTSRQIQILKAVIEEYLDTALPVGSDTLDKKFNLGVSPATIRNEMSYLSEQGYLKQPHTSAGRVPTSTALKLYVRELMNRKDLSVADEVTVKERVWESKDRVDLLLQQSARILAERLKVIGIAYSGDRHVYHAGYAHLLNMPEFANLDVTRTVLSLLEETSQLDSIFGKHWGDEPVHMIFGEDLGNRYLDPVSIVFTDFQCGSLRCALGIIGSCRINYAYAIPMLEHLRDVVVQLCPRE